MENKEDQEQFRRIRLAQAIITDAILIALEKTNVPTINAALATSVANFLGNMNDPITAKAIFLTGLEGLFNLCIGKDKDKSTGEIRQELDKKLQDILNGKK